MTRVALLHAYSPRNSGDGLLVQEALTFIHKSLGPEVDIDLFASRAEISPNSICHARPVSRRNPPVAV